MCGPESCSGSVDNPAPQCNGTGSCVAGVSATCANNLTCNAGGTACLTTCAVDASCVSGFYCAAPNCAAKKADGASCGGSNECTSGNCADGVCCNTACGGACDACTAALKGSGADGVCGNVAAGGAGSPTCTPYVCTGISPSCPATCSGDANCVSGDYCDAAFHCVPKLANGGVCTGNNQCQFGNCVDGVCCNNACAGLCTACTAALKGSGSDGTCGAIAAGTDPANECPTGVCDGISACVGCVLDANCLGTEYCDGANTCQPKKANGGACAGTNQCTSGNCVDAFCCDTACAGGCDVCNALNNEGTCTLVTAGGQGNPSCAPYVCWGSSACPTLCPLGDVNCVSGYYCDGSNACMPKKADGEICGGGSNECASGNCVDGVCCNTACAGSCDACNLAPNVGTCTNLAEGQAGDPSCSPYYCGGGASCPAGCEFDSECIPSHYCDDDGSFVCLGQLGNGSPCTRDRECFSGNCDPGPDECAP